jgi:hypothetical protein
MTTPARTEFFRIKDRLAIDELEAFVIGDALGKVATRFSVQCYLPYMPESGIADWARVSIKGLPEGPNTPGGDFTFEMNRHDLRSFALFLLAHCARPTDRANLIGEQLSHVHKKAS